ncbi:GTP 3',8-cyclase MoaA [Methanothermococcus okinawensis]|uniref:Probable GTP 3',8-cyclase n=1 Tax=Methanothermococcus okinawensis (strain DSM 14208 / JCM 11175 / IH1) TaxID=647113 RepID=F8AKH5_METOI|nr:GTP 3',8-cyclase MoaA [Methanothermococcus okinawensis]AEH07501.1 molybdenum cofactor biosynthesis protein A [Methanothermococcus okinawensis IH1]
MKDRFGREIRSLRISITPKCNLKCFYCHREGHDSENINLMTPSELGKIVKTSLKFGIKKVKISGGEPLLRNDLPQIIESISDDNLKDISLTTNGIFLEECAQKLKDAGLNRVNVSIDTLNPEKYKKITYCGDLEKVKRGVKEAINVGLTPLKINYLALSNTVEDLDDLMNYCRELGAILQIIEFIPLNEHLKKYHVDITPIENKIAEQCDKVITRKFMQNRKKYLVNGLEIEFVRPMDNTEFCSHCTRIRLTHDGFLKPCLLRDDNLVDILTPLRNGEDIEKCFIECINRREPYFKA